MTLMECTGLQSARNSTELGRHAIDHIQKYPDKDLELVIVLGEMVGKQCIKTRTASHNDQPTRSGVQARLAAKCQVKAMK